MVVIALPKNLSFPEEILRESRKIAEYFWVNKSIPILFYLYLATVTLDFVYFFLSHLSRDVYGQISYNNSFVFEVLVNIKTANN